MLSEKASGGTGREAAKKRPDAVDVCAQIEAGDMTVALELLSGLSLEDLVDFLLIARNSPRLQMAAADFSSRRMSAEQLWRGREQDYSAVRARASELLKEGIRKLEAQRSVADPFQDLSKELRKETLALLAETAALEEKASEH